MAHHNEGRRSFIFKSLLATGGLLLSSNFISCKDDDFEDPDLPDDLDTANFDYGVGSFDPTSSQVIIWTRYTTELPEVTILWQIASDIHFETILRSGELSTNAERDYTIAVEAQELEADQKLYYRFINVAEKKTSVVGETITLPTNAEELKLAVCSCSNFQAGLFNVYNTMAESDADLIVHLGDYIYEYGAGAYGSTPETEALGRIHEPAGELLTLDNYRERYKQYRGDKDLQLAHQRKPFICVWDDHEIANDAYKSGAENHQPDEGDYEVRKQEAIQAYSEYLPVRSQDINRIYRSINLGNLVNLCMLDTRIIGRDKQLSYTDYFTAEGTLDSASFQADWLDPQRSILGNTQKEWLINQVTGSSAHWQVLGQQVLMSKMYLPAELLQILSSILLEVATTGTTSPETLQQFQQRLTELVQLKARHNQNDPSLTEAEIARITTVLPYNLDAWDGYPVEREQILAAFGDKKVVCLAGDTHNAWSGVLSREDDTLAGREFATSSVTSPGFETYLGTNATALSGFEQAVGFLIDDLDYLDASNRGYLEMKFTGGEATGTWIFVDSITSTSFNVFSNKTINYSS